MTLPALGPLEFVVLAFPGERVDTEVVAVVEWLRWSGHMGVADALVIAKATDGKVTCTEIADLPELSHLGASWGMFTLIDGADADEVAEILAPGTCAMALVVDRPWAKEAAGAVRAAGGRASAVVRIQPQHAEEAVRAARDDTRMLSYRPARRAPLLRGAIVAAAPRPPQEDLAAKLAHLGQMMQLGLLTPEEFAAARDRLRGTRQKAP